MAKVYVFMADGCEEVEALAVIDLLRRAGEEVELVSIHNKDIQNTRVFLTYATGKVLKTGANLLGIQMPDKM